MSITFATPATIIQPKGNLIIETPLEQDHILGATGPNWDRVNIGGHWTELISPEMQRNRFGDTYMCTAFSLCSALEFVHKKKYGIEINLSDIFVGNGSGNIRGLGNSKRAPAEFVRTKGFLLEEESPYTSETSLDQVYAKMPQALYDQAAKRLNIYETGYKLLQDNSIKKLLDGIEFSPLRVDVEGRYVFGNNGYVVRNGSGDSHEVIFFDYELNKCWHCWDSENAQYIKFDWNFGPGNPMIHLISKKNLMKLYQETGKAAIYAQNPEDGTLVPFADGQVASGTLFKTLYGVLDYNQLPIIQVPNLAEAGFSFASYSFTTK